MWFLSRFLRLFCFLFLIILFSTIIVCLNTSSPLSVCFFFLLSWSVSRFNDQEKWQTYEGLKTVLTLWTHIHIISQLTLSITFSKSTNPLNHNFAFVFYSSIILYIYIYICTYYELLKEINNLRPKINNLI